MIFWRYAARKVCVVLHFGQALHYRQRALQRGPLKPRPRLIPQGLWRFTGIEPVQRQWGDFRSPHTPSTKGAFPLPLNP